MSCIFQDSMHSRRSAHQGPFPVPSLWSLERSQGRARTISSERARGVAALSKLIGAKDGRDGTRGVKTGGEAYVIEG